MDNQAAPKVRKRLYDMWAKRNVYFEVDLEDSVIRHIADYGYRASKYNSAKGYVLGGGYEVYILAFFIGLYSNRRRPLEGEKKSFGQPIQHWGNLEYRGERKPYPRLREYIFAAAVARTDIDFLALERGTIPANLVISALMKTMDEYANYGLHVLQDKLEEDKHYFTNNSSFLSIFIHLFTDMNSGLQDEESISDDDSDYPESLD